MKKNDKIIHGVERYGEIEEIPMTIPMHIVSLSSITVQLLLTVFAFMAFKGQREINALAGTGFSSPVVYLIFPLICWMLSFAFRIACRTIPIDMWRLPDKVKKGMKKDKGVLLKWMTLTLELETALCLLYMGGEPSNLFLLAWVLMLVFSVYYPGSKAINQCH